MEKDGKGGAGETKAGTGEGVYELAGAVFLFISPVPSPSSPFLPVRQTAFRKSRLHVTRDAHS